MSSIDERLVRMEFDNKQFESGTKETLGTLQKLKNALNLDKQSKSLKELGSATSKFNLSGLERSVDVVASRFSNLGIVGMTVLQNITNTAVNAGASIAKSFAFDPILDGMREYETQLNAVQTILANTSSKGTTIDQVNAALDELNTYADKTIYNFSEMTRNIGTFTAAGVDLDTAVSSIKGIANLAAASGSSATQAATAMYQLSQAIAAGRVQLMDWNSVVNAGMGGEQFQNALKRTAEHFGTNVDGMIEKYGSFRESLTRGQWLTSDVLTETLKQISGAYSEADLIAQGYTEQQAKDIVAFAKTAEDAATKVKTFTQLVSTLREALGSGWAQSWELIFGDFLEAKNLWTEVSDILSEVINKQADARNALLKTWKDLGGRDDLIAGVKAMFASLASYVKPIQDGFKEIFPPTTADQLLNLTKGFREFWENAKLGTEEAERFKNVSRNLAQALKNILDALGQATEGFSKFTSGLGGLADGILSIIEPLSEFIKNMTESIDLSSVFSFALSGLGSGLSGVGRVFSMLGTAISVVASAISGALVNLTSSLSNLTGGFSTAANGITTVFLKALELLPEGIGAAISALGNAIRNVLTALPIKELNSTLQDTFFTMILMNVNKFVHGLTEQTDPINEFLTKLGDAVDKFGELLDKAGGAIRTFTTSIKANILIKIAVALAILAVSMNTLAQVPIDKLGASLGILAGGLVVMMAALGGIMLFLKKTSGSLKELAGMATIVGQIRNLALSMVLFAGAIKLLSSALKDISDLSIEDLIKGVGAIAGMSAVLIGISHFAKNMDSLKSTAVTITAFALSMRIMAGALETFASFDLTELAYGLGALAASTGVMIAAIKILNKGSKGFAKSAAALVTMSLSLKLLSSAVKSFEGISFESVGAAIASVVGMVVALAIANKTLGKLDVGKSVGLVATLIAYSEAVKNFGEAALTFNEVDIGSIGKTIATVVSLMVVIGIFSKAVAKQENFIEMGVSLLAIGETIKSFAESVTMFKDLDVGTIIKGIAGIASGLVIMLTAMRFLPKDMRSESASFIVLALSLKVLASSIKDLADMSISEIGTSLLALAGSMAVLVTSMNLIKGGGSGPAALMVMALALSMLAGPIKMLGEMPFGNLIQGLAGLGASLAIVAVASNAFTGVSTQMLKMAGTLAALGASLTVFGIGLTAILYPIKTLGEMDTSQMLSGIAGLASVITTLYVMTTAINNLPAFSIKTLAKVTIMTAVIAAVGAVIGQIASIDTGAALAAAASLSAVLLSTSAAFAILTSVPLIGVAKAVVTLGGMIAGVAAIVSAAAGIAQIPGVQEFVASGANLLASIGSAIGGFFGSIIGGVGKGAIDAIGGALPGLGENLAEFAENAKPFFDTVVNIDPNVAAGVKSLAEAMMAITAGGILDALSKPFTGGSSMVEFGKQLADFAPYMKSYSDTIANVNPEAVTASANAAKALAEFANNIPKEGGFLQSIFGTADMPAFGEDLVEFAKSMKQYSDEVAGISPDAVTASANAAKALSELANNIPKGGGVFQDLFGSQNLETFGSQIEAFGMSMKAYSDSIVGINPEVITSSATAARALSDLATSLPNLGGLVSFFTGDKNLATFGMQITLFGEGLKNYANSIVGIDPEAISSSATAAKGLADLQSALGETGGFISMFTGDQDLGLFASNLESLGKGIKAYSDQVAGISPETAASITASITALQGLSGIQSALAETGGLASIFGGDQDLGSFATNLEALGTGIKGYSDKVAGITLEAISPSIDAITRLKEILTGLEGVNGESITTFVDGINKLSEIDLTGFTDAFSSAVTSFSEIMSTLSTTIANNAPGIVEAATGLATSLEGLSSRFENAGKSVGDGFINGLNSISNADLSGPMTTVTNNAIAALAGAEGQFKDTALKLMSSFTSGLSEGGDTATDEASSVAKACHDALEKAGVGAEGIGRDIMLGLARGIRNNKSAAVTAAKNAAIEAVNAAKAASGVNSPSWKYAEIGMYSMIGLANGITKNARIPERAARKSLTSVYRMAEDVASAIDYAQSNGFTPKIVPVLDTSMVESGMARLSGKTYGSLSASLSTKLSLVNSRLVESPQNGSEKAIIKELRKLDQDIRNLEVSSYTVGNVSYGDGTAVSNAVQDLARAIIMDRRS